MRHGLEIDFDRGCATAIEDGHPTLSTMRPERLFIALTLPPPIRGLLAGLCQPLPGVTWTRADQLHVTLRFLGDVPNEQIESLIARLATVQVASFVLPIEG